MSIPVVTPHPFHEKYHPRIYRRFRREAADHQLTIVQDDGLYRHLKMRSTTYGYGSYWYDVVTWPGNLVVQGGMGSYHFAIMDEDVFRWAGDGDMNPGYWEEKTPLNGERDRSIKTYEPGTVRGYIKGHLDEAIEAHRAEREADGDTVEDAAISTSKYRRRLLDQVNEELFPDEVDHWNSPHSEEEMHKALRDFEFDDEPLWHDTWEWDLKDYTDQYLWSCLAIPLAIRHYRAAKAQEAKTA